MPRSTALPKAIGYIRVSTAEQVNGFGLEVQETAIRDYAKGSWRLVDIESDEGISGSNGLDTRDGLANALARLEAREADALIVYRLDRLARDLVLQETVIRQLQNHNVSVRSVTEPDIDSEDATRVLVRQVLGAIAQYERVVIRSRMALGKAAKGAKGGYVGGRPPFGWRAEGKELVEIPEEQEIISTVRALRATDPPTSYRQIAVILGMRGMTPRGGGGWAPIMLQRIAERVHS